ncbi:MAG TPA: diguanylate cyclase, partial [Desulfobacterales bacterium]|nr:diguanylate cyclase [Desulfobacterales bacterium]
LNSMMILCCLGWRATESKGRPGEAGPLLLHQLELLGEELEKNLGKSMLDLSELAGAVMEMKGQLLEAVEAQKALGTTYINEDEIVEKANEITDRVLIKLIKEEYQEGSVSVARLGQIIRRLVPNPDELKRLLPKIKRALLEEGMPLEDYLELVRELGKELKSEELARLLEESSEAIGIEGKELIEEVRRNPAQAAELIYLAAEIRKEVGDEQALSDMLVEYIERLGAKMTLDMAKEEGLTGERHLKKVMNEVQTKILRHLEKKEMKDEVLVKLEEKLSQRMDEALERLRIEWLERQAEIPEQREYKELSVLETLEQSVGENEELGEILRAIRKKVERGEIDENDFVQIHREISNEKEKRVSRKAQSEVSAGILERHSLLIFLEKEMARSLRYGTSCSVLAFSLVKAKPRVEGKKGQITRQAIIEAVLHRLARALRDTDVIGQLRGNMLLAILPMTSKDQARLALRRVARQLQTRAITVDDIPLDVRVAGVALAVDVGD